MAKRTNKEKLLQTDIVLTADEMNALDDEKGDLWKFYITISRRRDFATGVAGKRTRINAQALKEAMSLTEKQGRPAFKVSGGSIEYWIKKLVEIGLLIDKGNYIFELPLAPIYNSIKNKSDRSQTGSQTGSQTLSNTHETSIKTDIKPSSESISQTGSQTGSQTEVRSPLNYRLHNITLHTADDFFQLLAKQGYYVNQLQDNKSTRAMVHTWINAGVTLEEAEIGIKHANAQKPPRPDTPSYYLKPVLQVRNDFEKAKQQASEVSNERLQDRPKPTTNYEPRKSSTAALLERVGKKLGIGEDDEEDE
jgi:hypothetical protein